MNCYPYFLANNLLAVCPEPATTGRTNIGTVQKYVEIAPKSATERQAASYNTPIRRPRFQFRPNNQPCLTAC